MHNQIRWTSEERQAVAKIFFDECVKGATVRYAVDLAQESLGEDRRRPTVGHTGATMTYSILNSIKYEIEQYAVAQGFEIQGNLTSARDIRRAAGVDVVAHRKTYTELVPRTMTKPTYTVKNDSNIGKEVSVPSSLGHNEVQVLLKMFDPLITILAKKIAQELRGTESANDEQPLAVPEQVKQVVGATFGRFQELIGSPDNYSKYIKALTDAGVDTKSLHEQTQPTQQDQPVQEAKSTVDKIVEAIENGEETAPLLNQMEHEMEVQTEQRQQQERNEAELEKQKPKFVDEPEEPLVHNTYAAVLKETLAQLPAELPELPKPKEAPKAKLVKNPDLPDVLIIGLLPAQEPFVRDFFTPVANVRLEQTYTPGLLSVIQKSDLVMASAKACSEHTIKTCHKHAKLFYSCANIAEMKEKLQVLLDGQE